VVIAWPRFSIASFVDGNVQIVASNMLMNLLTFKSNPSQSRGKRKMTSFESMQKSECKRLASKNCRKCNGDGWYLDYDGLNGDKLTGLICECVEKAMEKNRK
jgi:hypothetical protein